MTDSVAMISTDKVPTGLRMVGNPPTPAKSIVGPLLLWLALQLLALLISACGWRYAATERFPEPREQLAVQVILITQIATATLLFSYLFRTAAATAVVIATGWPMTLLAECMAGEMSPLPIVAAMSYVTIWSLALALLRFTLPTERAAMAATAVLVAWTFGSGFTAYLEAEYGGRSGLNAHLTLWRLSPLGEVFRLSEMQFGLTVIPWALCGTVAISSLGAVLRLILQPALPPKPVDNASKVA